MNRSTRILLMLLWSLPVMPACTPEAVSSEQPSPPHAPVVEPEENHPGRDETARKALQAENERLRARLARTMSDLYARTSEAERNSLLLELLRDPVSEVRGVGLGIVETRLSSGRTVPLEVRERVRAMIGDDHAKVRDSAATVVAQLGDEEAAGALLDRLAVEDVPAVRAALLEALGRLYHREALPAVLDGIETGSSEVASAAASALARLAVGPPLAPAERRRAVEVLVARYERGRTDAGAAGLREAAVTAMGVVGDDGFVPVLVTALDDEAATVRLAAANALSRMGARDAVDAIKPLLDDPDRGVRQAAVSVVATLGGKEYLPAILDRTDPESEPAEAVRRHAWDVGMAMLADAEAQTLRTAADRLAGREDALEPRIRVLRMLRDFLTAAEVQDAEELARLEQELGELLLSADRYAEAAEAFERAWRALAESDEARSPGLRLDWIEAVAAAGDIACVEAIADLQSRECLTEAMDRLEVRLEELKRREKHSAVIELSEAALEQLSERMTDRRRQWFTELRDAAVDRRDRADGRRVERLCEQLVSTDEATRQAARSELRAMSVRAVPHMLRLLRDAVADEPVDAETEDAILAELKDLAPELTDYDASAQPGQRLETIDRWLESHR